MKPKEIMKFILIAVMSILLTPVLIIHMITEVLVTDYTSIVEYLNQPYDNEEE